MPQIFSDPAAIADAIIRETGSRLVVGLPLGLGKANHIANALYARGATDRGLNLTFFSALTLEKPRPSNELEKRFIAPVIDRLFGGWPDLDYAAALHAGNLPPNIEVIEFFFLARQWMRTVRGSLVSPKAVWLPSRLRNSTASTTRAPAFSGRAGAAAAAAAAAASSRSFTWPR